MIIGCVAFPSFAATIDQRLATERGGSRHAPDIGAGRIDRPAPTVADAIEMTRIQRRATSQPNGPVAVFSPNGRRMAAVVWRGDLSRNTNIYALIVVDFDARSRPGSARTVLTRDFVGDPEDQNASAISGVTFLNDNRTLAFLGRDASSTSQVFTVDADTGRLTQLTRNPMGVQLFAFDTASQLRLYAGPVDSDEEQLRRPRYAGDGFLVSDPAFAPLSGSTSSRIQPAIRPSRRWARQYYFINEGIASPIYDSRSSRRTSPSDLDLGERQRGHRPDLSDEETIRSWDEMSVDPTGRYALFFPFSLRDQFGGLAEDALDTPYALVDLTNGVLSQPSDRAHPRTVGGPIWAPDGHHVAINVHALAQPGSLSADSAMEWVIVDLESHGLQRLPIPSGWDILSWSTNEGMVLGNRRTRALAFLARSPDGTWGQPEPIATAHRFSAAWGVASNNHVVVGVEDGPSTPPELVAIDLASGERFQLTDLNPELRNRRYARAEAYNWSHRYGEHASGLLFHPPRQESNRRYPLVLLLDDATLTDAPSPYVLDGYNQLSGNAIQTLAARGFFVLYLRIPQGMRGASECEIVREHVETAVTSLMGRQPIDPRRIGLSGWSRSAWYTECALMRGSTPFAAAAMIDGGARQYRPNRPYTDSEITRIRTPVLLQAHGLLTLARHSAFAERLSAFGIPSEILYFPTASHSTTRPQHRFRSLDTHLDWWQFWLQDHEDTDQAKSSQYAHWRELREQQRELSLRRRPPVPLELFQPMADMGSTEH